MERSVREGGGRSEGERKCEKVAERKGGRKVNKTSVFTFPKDHTLYCDKSAKYDDKVKNRKKQAKHKAKVKQEKLAMLAKQKKKKR